MKTACDTRDAAFHALSDRAQRQRQVLDVIRRYGPITDKQIAERLGWPINCVTGRRGELVGLGRACRRGSVSSNNRRVAVWVEVAEPEPVVVEKDGSLVLAL
jgi:hypothetical protein